MSNKLIICAVCAAFAVGAGTVALKHHFEPNVIKITGQIPIQTEQELILNSDLIIEGIVQEIGQSKWSNPELTEGKRNVLQTDITVSINNIISGDYSSDAAVVRIDKGYDEESNTVVESNGYPDFTEGEQVVLFLSRDDGDLATDEDYFVLTGMRQGKWELSGKNEATAHSTDLSGDSDSAVYSAESYEGSTVEALKAKIAEEKALNPNWKEEQAERNAQAVEDNKALFGE